MPSVQTQRSDFKDMIYWLVWHIPRGRVISYSELAAVAGSPRAARIVGGIAHYGPDYLPWHRVVRKDGGLATGFPGGVKLQKSMLQSEGILFNKDEATIANLQECRWSIPRCLMSPLVVLVGPTASGKSTMALKLAQQFNGSIISADAWNVRKGMDIGSAKPSKKDQQLIPHYMIDVARPDERFTVSDFQKGALNAIDSIALVGRLPILCGGNGLYVDSVLYSYQFRAQNESLQKKLQLLNIKQLQKRLDSKKIVLNNSDYHNKKRLIRALESDGQSSPSAPVSRPRTLVLGLSTEDERLRQQIEDRVDHMLSDGLEKEVRTLSQNYGWDIESMKGIGYKEFRDYFEKKGSIIELKKKIVHANISYVKRQKTWFSRNKQIIWIQDILEAESLVDSFLRKNHV